MITLHDEIERILRLQNGGPMSAPALAQAVNAAENYRKRDGSKVEPVQIHARVSHHPDRFERVPEGIRLRYDKPPSKQTRSEQPSAGVIQPAAPPLVELPHEPSRPWYWEGNVQTSLARHLQSDGWTIERSADTSSQEPGIDLVATKEKRILAIEVKGYPGTVYARGPRAGQPKPTPPTLQARHWYADALLKAVLTGTSRQEAELALAFPDFPRYRRLIARSDWALRRLGIRVFFVDENDNVEVSGDM